MKYFIRSVKYFIYFSLMCAAIVLALVLIGAVEGDVNSIFDEGYTSIGKIAVFFALVAAVYPKLSFISREIPAGQQWKEIREDVVRRMEEYGYELENETDETIAFRLRGITGRLKRMYEDRITLTRTTDGYLLEGHRKDVLRLSNILAASDRAE